MLLTATRRVRGIAALTLITLALAACSAGSDATPLPSGAEPPADCVRVDADGVITLSANNLEFSAPCLVATAGEPFVIRFENQEAVPHNVALYEDDAKANEITRGDIITGPEVSIDYEIEALEAGEYYFDCTVHTAMNGALYVVSA